MNSFAFDQITGTRVPGSQVEFSNRRAVQGLPPAPQKILLIGQRLDTGSVAALMPRRIVQVDEGAAFFGRGSMLAGMIAAAIGANQETELWAIGIDSAIGDIAAYRRAISAAATGSGAIYLMIGGVRVTVAVTTGDTVGTMATAVTAAINALPDLPVTAATDVTPGNVNITFRHAGVYGNALDLRLNHYDGEALPAGVVAALSQTTPGTGTRDLTPVWAAIGDEHFTTIAIGTPDAAALTSADVELTARWGPQRQKEGRAYAAIAGSYSTCVSFGTARNGIFTTVIGGNKVPTPPWRMASAFAAIAALHLAIDPARPLTDLVVPGVLAPRIEHRFTRIERDQLLRSGISTFRVPQDGSVAIERLISCYQLNALGYPDASYLDVTTTATLAYYRTSWRQRMAAKFPRAKLTDDTIAAVRAETIALARDWEDAGLMEDVDGFIANLVIERDASNATQLNLLMTPDVVNGLLQLAARVEFIL